ncbi:MAG: trypsin-like peptidase domain-containing protein [Acetobacteraceae bacterium]|nr:trypsin-like peptidase domain-containing protein [Acetobacteraceae bacterium]
MRRFLPPLIGIPLGLAIAGLAVLHVSAVAGPPIPTPPTAAPLPHVLPMPYDPLRPPPDATVLASGTGFFAATHLVVTAAHVVSHCRAIRLVSAHLPPTRARLAAVDDANDIAILHADAPAPAILQVGGDSQTATRLVVYGYPAAAPHDPGAKSPAGTWARLVNDRVAATASLERNPHTLLWMQSGQVAQGYSGGPILDPASGHVVGIVRALIDPQRAAAAYGIAMPDLSIGPGTAPLRAMLADSPTDAPAGDGDIFARAHRAIVHVLCWQ